MILLFFESLLFDRFVGRGHRDARLTDGEQVTGRRQLRFKEERTAYHHQGEAAGDPEDGVLADAQADEAYTRAARQGNGAAHEGHPGKHLNLFKWRLSMFTGRISSILWVDFRDSSMWTKKILTRQLKLVVYRKTTGPSRYTVLTSTHPVPFSSHSSGQLCELVFTKRLTPYLSSLEINLFYT